jgi:hypothetical protein
MRRGGKIERERDEERRVSRDWKKLRGPSFYKISL